MTEKGMGALVTWHFSQTSNLKQSAHLYRSPLKHLARQMSLDLVSRETRKDRLTTWPMDGSDLRPSPCPSCDRDGEFSVLSSRRSTFDLSIASGDILLVCISHRSICLHSTQRNRLPMIGWVRHPWHLIWWTWNPPANSGFCRYWVMFIYNEPLLYLHQVPVVLLAVVRGEIWISELLVVVTLFTDV